MFRAQKRSTAAKRYKGKKFTRAAYDVKNWSLSEICRICQLADQFVWGWKYDAKAINYEWVLYVDTPFGQVSFHSAERLAGPNYPGDWDGARLGRERVLQYCDHVMGVDAVVVELLPVPTVPQAAWNAVQEMLDMRALYDAKSGATHALKS